MTVDETAEAMVTAAMVGRSDLLGAVVDSLGDGVAVVDGEGAPLLHNRAAAALGVEHAPDIDDTAQQNFGLFQPDGVTPFAADDTPMALALAGESSDAVEILARNAAHPEGVLLAVSGRPLQDATGHPAAVAVFRDVTADRAQRSELEAFASVAAHDLKAPLTIVTGYLELIADLAIPQLTGDTAGTVIDALRRAHEGTTRMNQLIEDLLHYAASDAALAIVDVDLRGLVEEAVARRTGHVTGDEPAPDISVGRLPWVRGDRARLTQVVDNLLDNALKYTPPGQAAHIEVTAQRRMIDGTGNVHLQIADRGIGIPAGQHDAIFTSFHRAHADGPYRGTGLGLTICQRIVQAHGGRIHATDNPGGGTCVHVTLPAVVPPEPCGSSAASASPGARWRPARETPQGRS